MAAVVALVLILFLFRPGVYKLRNRISTSIGSALGRRVTIDNVRFRLLPRPGFDLDRLVVYDDPGFSAEPMIRADEVSAAIRFRSLLRGRLEIATLSANEPSINLVRNDQGRWNLASLLERNAQIPVAPTEKSASEGRPVFPYLEASNARVNFKLGQTKKSYALMNADVALWQDSENSWSARIQAEPVRTDFHLTDTGIVQINATWQRASNVRLTPLAITMQWRYGQLGQITKLLSGKDRGWRGEVNFAAKLSGTPETLRIESQTAVEDFRRYDIVDTENARLGTACSGEYSAVTGALADLRCESPVGGGALRLRGSATLIEPSAYDLTLEAENVPLTSVVRLLRHTKKQIPSDLTASGLLNAEFHAKSNVNNFLRRPARTGHGLLPRWSGTGSATDVHMVANSGKDEVVFGTIPLTLISGSLVSRGREAASPTAAQRSGRAHPTTKQEVQQKPQEPAETHLRVGPVMVAMNDSAPVTGGGWISAAGYLFSLRGDAELKDLFRLESLLGVPAALPAVEGSAKLDVRISGSWQGFAAPSTFGSAQLRNGRAEVPGLNTPIEISSATLSLTPEAVQMQKISAHTGNTHWSGEVIALRHCAGNVASDAVPSAITGDAPSCQFQFDLTADQFSAGDIAEWFTPQAAKRPWYRILNSESDSTNPLDRSPLLAIQARGSVRVGRLGLKKVVATQVAAQVEVDRGRITLSDLRAQLLQGTHQGKWILDVSSRELAASGAASPDRPAQSGLPLRFHGAGTLQNISLDQVGTLMNDAWISGTVDGNFDMNGSANNFRELLARSDGDFEFAMRDGSLRHIEIPGSAGPLTVHRFTGEMHLKEGVWELSAGRMESRDGFYLVSGTASPGSVFDFVLTRGDEQSWALTGTLAKPHVSPIPRTEARRADVNARETKP
jgi:hypothetical protein